MPSLESGLHFSIGTSCPFHFAVFRINRISMCAVQHLQIRDWRDNNSWWKEGRCLIVNRKTLDVYDEVLIQQYLQIETSVAVQLQYLWHFFRMLELVEGYRNKNAHLPWSTQWTRYEEKVLTSSSLSPRQALQTLASWGARWCKPGCATQGTEQIEGAEFVLWSDR